jgi:DNA glycosylase AlkZ-like
MLGPRALNRALLARQMLIARDSMAPLAAIEHLVGMQAQAPLAPYVGLWSRLDGFDPATLSAAIVERQAVRTSLMRATIHLVTARDAVWLRPLVDPVLARGFRTSQFGPGVADVDLAEVLAVGRTLLEARPMTSPELAVRLAERWPEADRASLVFAVGYLVPLAHVPPRGVWGETGPVARTTLESWLGRPLETDPPIDELALRYLAAFGPATVMDIQAWSGLTRLRPVFERLRPGLATFRDDAGRELFDLPDAPLPDPETPAPPRFLPEYDNVLLAHADRSRIIRPGRRIPLPPGNGATRGTILLDGMFAGEWRFVSDDRGTILEIEPFEPIAAAEQEGLHEEGERLLAFGAVETEGRIVVREPIG